MILQKPSEYFQKKGKEKLKAEKNLSFREDESKSTIGPHTYFVVPLVSPQWGVHVADMQVKDNLGSERSEEFHGGAGEGRGRGAAFSEGRL
nr:hypothetical protein CFP56_69774 [Quercus suber]